MSGMYLYPNVYIFLCSYEIDVHISEMYLYPYVKDVCVPLCQRCNCIFMYLYVKDVTVFLCQRCICILMSKMCLYPYVICIRMLTFFCVHMKFTQYIRDVSVSYCQRCICIKMFKCSCVHMELTSMCQG